MFECNECGREYKEDVKDCIFCGAYASIKEVTDAPITFTVGGLYGCGEEEIIKYQQSAFEQIDADGYAIGTYESISKQAYTAGPFVTLGEALKWPADEGEIIVRIKDGFRVALRTKNSKWIGLFSVDGEIRDVACGLAGVVRELKPGDEK
jgi:hypothetical protein